MQKTVKADELKEKTVAENKKSENDNLENDDLENDIQDYDYYLNTLLMIKQLDAMINQKANNSLKGVDLTFSQFILLNILNNAKDKTLTLKKIEKKLNIASSTSAGLICRMKMKGLIISKRSKNDARVTIVKMTKKGEKKLSDAVSHSEKVKEIIFSHLEIEEIEQLKKFLAKSIKILENYDE
ncbi:MAG: MarR family transcriptional regulator [Lachnospiraceae bacterium]|nr:MarR family transcriptional regulator [Lachnospiraceae bacterium]